MNTVIRKRYSSDFKAQALELVSLGKTVPQVAQELGIGTSILYRWAQPQGQSAQLGSAASLTPTGRGEGGEADELRRLREDNALLRMENDILKKAAVILGTQPLSRHAR
jgi:transposase